MIKDLLAGGPQRYKKLLETVYERNTLIRYFNSKFFFILFSGPRLSTESPLVSRENVLYLE